MRCEAVPRAHFPVRTVAPPPAYSGDVAGKSRIERGAWIGLWGLGAGGAMVGLVRGLQVRPSTAWFAAFEVGFPSAFVGAIVGVLVGYVTQVIARGKAAHRRDVASPD